MSSSSQEKSIAVSPVRWRLGSIPVIGLTGGIGSGKSRVASLLARRGAVVIDADRVGHEVLGRPEIQSEVVRRFGERVLQDRKGGTAGEVAIDRKALGAIVFSDPDALHDLEALLHPLMEREFQRRIEVEAEGSAHGIVLDAAILLEQGWDRFCDLVVFVDSPWETRLHRVAASRGWDASTLQARESAQWSTEAKRLRADRIVPNQSTLEALERAVNDFWESLVHSPSGKGEGLSSAIGPGYPQPQSIVTDVS